MFFSIGWNTVHLKLDCCGIRGINDWIDSDWFASNQSDADVFPIGQFKKSWPATCCVLSDESKDSYLVSGQFEATNRELQQCYSAQPAPSEFTITRGCFEEVNKVLDTIVYLTAAFFTLLSLLMSLKSSLVYFLIKSYQTQVLKTTYN